MAALNVLLTREAFKTEVFRRSVGCCVFCGQPAVDAHHILERKLFPDGGYYAGNGASVCEHHHWECETTLIPVETVRRAAGIFEPVLAPGLLADAIYDKWGNRVWPSRMRSLGPLGREPGMVKALKRGGYLGLLMPVDYRE